MLMIHCIVLLLLYVCFVFGSLSCIVFLSLLSSFEIILLEKRDLIARLYLYSCCCVITTGRGLVSVSPGIVGWSVVCEFSISWPHSLMF